MNRIGLLIASTALTLPLLSTSTLASNAAATAVRTIQGTWAVEVTLRVDAPDCTIAPVVGVGPNPFPSFNAFNEGGTMNEWGTRAPPATRGAGHGVWKRTADDKFRYRVLFHSFDENGLLTATMDIRSNLRISKDGKKFVGVSRFLRTDISGNEQHFCATLDGNRITL